MKIKFNTDDNLSLNKPWTLCMLTIIVRSVFKKDGKFLSGSLFRRVFVWVRNNDIAWQNWRFCRNWSW